MMLALPMLFCSCQKEDQDGYVSVKIEYDQLNSWLGIDGTTLASQLESRGYTSSSTEEIENLIGIDIDLSALQIGEHLFIYKKINDNLTYSQFVYITTSNGTVAYTQSAQESMVSALSSAANTLSRYVNQERNMLTNETMNRSYGNIAYGEDSHSMTNNDYNDWSAMETAINAITEHHYIEMAWADEYNTHTAGVAVGYTNEGQNENDDLRYQLTTIALCDNALMRQVKDEYNAK